MLLWYCLKEVKISWLLQICLQTWFRSWEFFLDRFMLSLLLAVGGRVRTSSGWHRPLPSLCGAQGHFPTFSYLFVRPENLKFGDTSCLHNSAIRIEQGTCVVWLMSRYFWAQWDFPLAPRGMFQPHKVSFKDVAAIRGWKSWRALPLSRFFFFAKCDFHSEL